MQVEAVDSLTLKRWIESGQVVLIDVREPSEYQMINIPSAVNIPKGNAILGALPSHVGRKLVFHCRSGMRSKMVCKKILKQDGALDVYNLKGGIKAWKSHGFETVTEDSSCTAEELIIMLITAFLVCTSVLLLIF